MVFFYLCLEWLSRITAFNNMFTKTVESSMDTTLDSGELRGYHWAVIASLWFVIHITHWGMYIGNILAVVFICANEQWYIALPLVTIISNPLIGGIHCAFNNLENNYRARLGWPLIEANFLPTVLKEIKDLINATFFKG